MSSINDKLERVRKPRVHIKYEVETNGAEAEKELPFVVGVIGDYVGNNPGEELKPMKDRKFVNIDRDNFDTVMHNMKPGVKMRVENTLDDSATEMSVELQFNSMEDFEPAKVAEQVPALRELKAVRDKLRDLLTKTDRSDKLEGLLEKVLRDESALKSLARELGVAEKQGEANE
jgi:type VI secretion system protein ImpB